MSKLCEQVIGKRLATLKARAAVLSKEGSAPPHADTDSARVGPPELLRLNAASKGLLLGIGDSWFAYFSIDVLDLLEDEMGYTRTSVAVAGTSLKAITASPDQLVDLSKEIERTVGGAAPKAILLSGGGNDFVDFGIENLLNEFAAGEPRLKADVVSQLIDKDIKSALVEILECINCLCQYWLHKTIPILIHGYAYPIPDGRYLRIPRRGPWLEPAFLNKGYDKLNIGPQTEVMKALITRLNQMQKDIAGKKPFENVRHVDVQEILKAPPHYTKMWGNELHPTYDGFVRVAKAFATELQKP